MNTWTTYSPPVTMIDPGDGVERPVRGLGIEDLSLLVVNHLDTMMEVTSLYIESQKDVFAKGNLTELLIVISRSFPGFVAEVIAMVTDTPELRTVKVPVAAQMMILQAAVKLTVEDAGGMGNLSALLQTAAKQAMANRGEVSQKLQAILSPSSTMDAAKTRSS